MGDTNPDDLLVAVLEATIQQTGIDPKEVGDVIVGNVQLGGAYAGPARMAQLRAGFPVEVPLHSVNRQCSSGLSAVAAQAAGKFKSEIVPVTVKILDGEGKATTVVVDKDDGPRQTTLEALGKLKTVFKKDGGTVTAGTSSKVSDGAAAVLLMRRDKAEKLGLKPMGVFRGAKVVGVLPENMGVGPAVAIPAAVEACGLNLEDIDIYEINEAFAAQALYCVRKLNIPMEKVNPKGGAIALGHPLGATGARQVATLMSELKATDKKLGVISMCIGTGMGMAAVIEAE